ncbi:hypothetical protein G5I_05384 [Acromyrmex echinatior]|uniref:Uncharacterized protein n=1 Tax=Acromyrmex echinatior TaxID=103372 RepID=F4WI62_ACREC|nr:hypothetical protein G5I_05384 [Acromyrmex echinatior]
MPVGDSDFRIFLLKVFKIGICACSRSSESLRSRVNLSTSMGQLWQPDSRGLSIKNNARQEDATTHVNGNDFYKMEMENSHGSSIRGNEWGKETTEEDDLPRGKGGTLRHYFKCEEWRNLPKFKLGRDFIVRTELKLEPKTVLEAFFIFFTNMLQEFILSYEIQEYLCRLYRLTEKRRIAVDESDEEERRWMGGRVVATHQREGEGTNRGRRGWNFARARLYPPWLPPPSPPPPPPPPLDAEGSWTARVSSTTSCCETELSVKRSRVPFFWTRARKTTRSSLARDTLQLVTTIMLAGIFEGNNVREKSFAIGSSVACVLHFLANVHAVVKLEREDNEYMASRRRPKYFFIKREFGSNRNAQMVCANTEITFCGLCGVVSRKEIEFRELERDCVAWNYATRVLLLLPGFAEPEADSSHEVLDELLKTRFAANFPEHERQHALFPIDCETDYDSLRTHSDVSVFSGQSDDEDDKFSFRFTIILSTLDSVNIVCAAKQDELKRKVKSTGAAKLLLMIIITALIMNECYK